MFPNGISIEPYSTLPYRARSCLYRILLIVDFPAELIPVSQTVTPSTRGRGSPHAGYDSLNRRHQTLRIRGASRPVIKNVD